MDKANLPVDLAGGRASLNGQIALPLKKGTQDQVVFDVTGTLRDLDSELLIRDRVLRAPELDLTVDNDRVILTGAGTLDGVGFDGSFVQPIGPGAGASGVRADITLDRPALDTFGIALPPGTVAGETRARLEVDLPKGRAPQFDLQSDLAGLRLSVPQLGWAKAAGTTGSLQVSGQLGATPSVDRLALSAAGLTTEGAVSLREGGALERVRFDTLRAGGWLDAAVDVVGQGPGNPVQLVIRGGVLDLRSAELGGGADGGGQGGGGRAPPMQVQLDRLQITDTIALTDMRGNFATAGGWTGRFRRG